MVRHPLLSPEYLPGCGSIQQEFQFDIATRPRCALRISFMFAPRDHCDDEPEIPTCCPFPSRPFADRWKRENKYGKTVPNNAVSILPSLHTDMVPSLAGFRSIGCVVHRSLGHRIYDKNRCCVGTA